MTGTLLAGVLVGQLGVTVSPEVKQCFFVLFLFSIGYRCGPQFFQGLRKDGLAQAAIAAIVVTTGLIVAFLVARVFGYDPGTAGRRDRRITDGISNNWHGRRRNIPSAD